MKLLLISILLSTLYSCGDSVTTWEYPEWKDYVECINEEVALIEKTMGTLTEEEQTTIDTGCRNSTGYDGAWVFPDPITEE